MYEIIPMERRIFIQKSLILGACASVIPHQFSFAGTKKEIAFIDRILPAPVGGGYQDPDYWIWGSSVIKGEDGKYN